MGGDNWLLHAVAVVTTVSYLLPCFSFPTTNPCVKMCKVNLSPWLALKGHSSSSGKEREGPLQQGHSVPGTVTSHRIVVIVVTILEGGWSVFLLLLNRTQYPLPNLCASSKAETTSSKESSRTPHAVQTGLLDRLRRYRAMDVCAPVPALFIQVLCPSLSEPVTCLSRLSWI